MPIPDYQTLMRPLLATLGMGPMTLRKLVGSLIDQVIAGLEQQMHQKSRTQKLFTMRWQIR